MPKYRATMWIITILAATIALADCKQSPTDSETVQDPVSVPQNVTDLAVVNQSENALTISLTEVNDGGGNPAKYAVRFAPSPISWADAVQSETVIPGRSVGSRMEFQLNGLTPGTQYDIQCVAFRGTLGVNAVFSEQLSNIVTATTGGTVPPPPPPGPEEPVFDAAVHSSLWHDDFSSYTSLADMQSGNGAHEWAGDFTGWAFVTGTTPEDSYIQAAYLGSGEITREITARDNVLAGQDPDQVLMTVMIRSVGTPYAGKTIVFKTGSNPYTTMRWVPRMTSSKPIPEPDLPGTYWTPDWPWDRLPGTDAIPRADSYGLALARDWGQCGSAQSNWDYKQNVGWSQLQPWSRWADGNWHRWTVRWTKGTGSGPCGDGQGRIEWWWDGVLVFQWLGDDPTRPEYGKVFVGGAGEHAIGQPYWFGPSKFNWQGGGYLELDEVRFWTE